MLTNDRLGMEVDNIKEAIRFLEKARDIYTDIGHGGGAESAQIRINQIKKFNGDEKEEDRSSFPVGSRVIIQNLVKGAKYNGLHGIVKSKIDTTTLRQNVFIIDEEKTIAIKPTNMEVCDNELSELMYWKEMYEMNSASGDTNSILYSGERLFQALMNQKGRGLEARRLMLNLIKRSRQTHGDEHEVTKELESHLVKMVGAKHPEFGMQMFEVVKYESNMEKVILKGPVLDENARDEESEETLTFNADEVYLGLNCPVICHGLEDADDTKGKMGQIMSWDKETDIYTVKFEDESVTEVKRGNTRVALDFDAHE